VKKFLIALLFLLSFSSASACAGSRQPLHGNPYQNPGQAPDFTLPSMSGSDFTLSAEQGRVVFLYFGYTFCPDICPATLGQLRSILSDARIDPAQVRVVMVTVDPDRDTSDVLLTYLSRFGPEFIGVRADGEQLASVLAAYGVYAEIEAGSDPEHYLVAHNARVFVIDRAGRLVTHYSFDTPAEDIRLDLERLLSR
jgi:protein SCO1/2